MKVEEFINLKAGQVVYDRQFNTYGEVCEGPWLNNGISLMMSGAGRYIKWQDGDNSCVGLSRYKDQDIAHFELYDGQIT